MKKSLFGCVGVVRMPKVSPNPEVLRWARENSNWSLPDIAAKMGKPVSVIEAWEKGQESPTYVQLERLAHDYYKRPVAVFFFPSPPEIESPKEQFRTLPGLEYEKLSPKVLSIIRRAQTMILNLKELTGGSNPAKKHILKSLRGIHNITMPNAVSSVRTFLGISLDEQLRWQNEDKAFERWREALWDCGVSVFKDAFHDKSISGFCLFDTEFPVVYVNNSLPKTRQIFTLFHELAHLLSETGGVTKVIDDHLGDLNESDRRVEIFCNRFAAQFLVPDEDFESRVLGLRIEERYIEDLARKYSVSREVILRKLLDMGRVSQEYYDEMTRIWVNETEFKDDEESGGHYYNTMASYLGKQYLNLAFGQYYRKQISIYELSEYLGVKVENIPRLESACLR